MQAGTIGVGGASSATARSLREAALLAAAIVALSLPWSLPARPEQLAPAALLAVAGEIVLLLALLALAAPLRQGRMAWLLRYGVGIATALVVLLSVAELLIRSTLARPLNPLLDLHLAASLVRLLTGTLGGVLGWLALVGVATLPVVAGVVAIQAMRVAQRLLGQRRWRLTTLAAAALAAACLAWQHAHPQALESRTLISFRASETIAEQWRRGRAMALAAARFERATREEAFADLPPEMLLAQLGGIDVLLMFIESYGRSALEQERYAARLLPRLEGFGRRIDAAGLSAASGYLTSPTVGGQSWLAHGTLESGLWLDNQLLYDLLLTSERLTLTRAFAQAGHRTVALKPAITLPWPEGERLGFARIYAAADLGYAGLPYNWVTMPDQYTLSVLERQERGPHDRPGRPPLFAEVSLISSHAPWTPIPPLLEDWDEIGDGLVFSQWAATGDPPEVVWRDPERVRHQYTLALDYVLGVLGSYAARFVDRRTLLILVGDHQPAPLITGEGASRDVPMHVISAAPELLEPFLDWGFAPGLLPPDRGEPKRMDAFRDWFLAAFSGPNGASGVAVR